ncbi:ArnT family glycosyltransferase [Polluticoccus soli]|uniref:ArnT family glycosyltransferase n=1 Tax=Polluticoccus soli TaxID=3034150 RepID=UPI0023E20A04|nr:glycosyltransferase family 39 protein [Flavipsychrobacter sp. JY13-12]
MKKAHWGYLIVAMIIAVPLFGNLDRLPLLEWDESRLATNSLEMLGGSRNLLVPTFGGVPDMWNCKPPFLIWIQALSMKAFGINELALRLPSAVAASILCLFLFWSVGLKLRKPVLAIIACAVLVTSEGYVSTHGTRTADYDSMLTLFTTMYGMLFFLFFEERKLKYLYAAFACLGLGVLTKGVAAMFFTPAIFMYALVSQKRRSIFRSRHLYIGASLFLMVSLGYYLLREHYNPGYLKAVYDNELGGRFAKVNEDHVGPWDYYLEFMISWRFNFWIYTLPFGVIAGARSKSPTIQKLTLYTSLLVLFFFTVISTAKTKLDWYDMPMYPWLSLIVGFFIYAVYQYLLVAAGRLKDAKWLAPLSFLVFVFIVPYRAIYHSIVNPAIDFWSVENMNMGYMLKDAKDKKINIDGYKLVWDDYAPNLEWYLMAYDGRVWVSHLRSDQIQTQTKSGDKIAIFKTGTRRHVEAQDYPLKPVDSYHGVIIYQVY